MHVICELIRDKICGYEFKTTPDCEHQFKHDLSTYCNLGACGAANRNTMCVPVYEITIPDELFEL